uniref:non-specific serine/threonine protein kinase n=1 Tax=Lutzomyia longipalpis TaxID=7200 RepID=A0A1B0GJS0_LUTLO
MNSSGGKTPSSARLSEYTTNALEQIRKDLCKFVHINNGSQMTTDGSTTPQLGQQQVTNHQNLAEREREILMCQQLTNLINAGYSEDQAVNALKQASGRPDGLLFAATKPTSSPESPINGHSAPPPSKLPAPLATKLMRKHSIERELSQALQYNRNSPALDSGAGSSRSDSPHSHQQIIPSRASTGQYSPSPCPSSFSDAPPLPPPRCSSTPPTPPPVPVTNFQQLFKRMSPATNPTARSVPLPSQSPARGTSPVSAVGTHPRQPMIVQNGPQAQQQLSQQMQALSLYQSGGNSGEPPPPYPIISAGAPPPPPSYTASIQSRQSPTQSSTTTDYRKSPSSGIYSATSAGSPSPITVSQAAVTPPHPAAMARPIPLPAWGARQTKTQPPIIMQSVKSTQVQKPVLQTAIAPAAPTTPCIATTVAPPSYASSIHQKSQATTPSPVPTSKPPVSAPSTPPAVVNGNVTPQPVVPTTEPPSYASTMQALLAGQQSRNMPPPPPYTNSNATNARTTNGNSPGESPTSLKNGNLTTTPPLPPTASSSVAKVNGIEKKGGAAPTAGTASTRGAGESGPCKKIKHHSPIPVRKNVSKEKEAERKEFRIRHYSPQAFKFFMEQHIENVLKSYKARLYRRNQLEREMLKMGLTTQSQTQMRKMLCQKESNYIRLKRAKMDKSMFLKIKDIGVGAFGEVSLVRKIDATNHLYAMKTLRKADVLKRNQVAHVKAERDILAEADNDWVVKLYYSFQDEDNLYFVMDYIPGGDLMSLLIKKEIFEEPLARFYIAELTCAVESVHKMGFIHRDIKPDNILIDRDGHIKLTDFGLCTGFRWTHDSKYYQKNGEHARQDSMEPWDDNGEVTRPSVLERRQRAHQRGLAHSLVGTPNYIAPEVLERSGYTQLCDWWSVGVILYEMLVGQPPFLANTPGETQHKVINWETTLHIPPQAKLSRESADMILKLCSSPDRRLGKNADEVKAHPFFKSIDFSKNLREQPAPYIPKIEHPTDTSNFDPVDPGKLRNSSLDSGRSDEFSDTGKPFHGFFEFTFRRFFDDNNTKIAVDGNDDLGPVYV